jgi:hypothetical protein
MLRVWFSCPFVSSELGVEIASPLEVYIKDEQRAAVLLFIYLFVYLPHTSVDANS